MGQFENIKAYLDGNRMTVEDMKESILESALNLGCNVENNFEENAKDTAQVFCTLNYFNDMLNKVK